MSQDLRHFLACLVFFISLSLFLPLYASQGFQFVEDKQVFIWEKLLFLQKVENLWISRAEPTPDFLPLGARYSSVDDAIVRHEQMFRQNPHMLLKEAEQLRCLFPARYVLLAARLQEDAEETLKACKNLQKFLEPLHDAKLGMAFVDYHMADVASTFGHSVVVWEKILPSSWVTFVSPLQWQFNIQPKRWIYWYAAEVRGNESPWDYVWKGASGGFIGSFSLEPYAKATYDYRYKEKRFIWQYGVQASREELGFLKLVMYEHLRARIPYYFFTQNCSSMLLYFLNVFDYAPETKSLAGVVAPVHVLQGVHARGRLLAHGFDIKRSPAESHGFSRFSLGVVYSSDFRNSLGLYAEGRLFLHGPDDPVTGFSRHSFLEIGKFGIVYWPEISLWRLSKVNLFLVRSLEDIGKGMSWAWEFRLGLVQPRLSNLRTSAWGGEFWVGWGIGQKANPWLWFHGLDTQGALWPWRWSLGYASILRYAGDSLVSEVRYRMCIHPSQSCVETLTLSHTWSLASQKISLYTDINNAAFLNSNKKSIDVYLVYTSYFF